jgi:single-strand DNA-binding protein
MSGVNKVILVGNVGKDPEIRYLESNVPVAKFTLATNEVYRNKDGQKIEQTEWHQIVLWRHLAEVAEKFVRKGTLLYVEGRIKSRSWVDKDGVKKYTTEIEGENITILSKRNEDAQPVLQANSAPEQARDQDSNSISNVSSDGLPF